MFVNGFIGEDGMIGCVVVLVCEVWYLEILDLVSKVFVDCLVLVLVEFVDLGVEFEVLSGEF